MKTIYLQKQFDTWIPVWEEDKAESSEYKDNQVVEFQPKTVGAKKLRSLKQLRMYWGLIRTVFQNSTLFMSEAELSEYVKLKIGYIDSVIYINGTQHMITGSIAIDKMEHMKMCGYMDRAIDYMASIIGVTKEALLLNYERN